MRNEQQPPKSVFGPIDAMPKADRAGWITFWTTYYNAPSRGARAKLFFKQLLPLVLAMIVLIGWYLVKGWSMISKSV
jgi:hypothetical protein